VTDDENGESTEENHLTRVRRDESEVDRRHWGQSHEPESQFQRESEAWRRKRSDICNEDDVGDKKGWQEIDEVWGSSIADGWTQIRLCRCQCWVVCENLVCAWVTLVFNAFLNLFLNQWSECRIVVTWYMTRLRSCNKGAYDSCLRL